MAATLDTLRAQMRERGARDERQAVGRLLQEFGLSHQEGVALMCIAEALLRGPDDPTADRLIGEQLASGDWSAHAMATGGNSELLNRRL